MRPLGLSCGKIKLQFTVCGDFKPAVRHVQRSLPRSRCTNVKDRAVKEFKEMPGPLSLPLVGTLYQYLPLVGRYSFLRMHRNGFEKFARYGPIVREEIAPGSFIVWLFEPADIEKLFRSEGRYPQRRSHLALEKYRLDKPNVYKTGGLLPTNGAQWHQMRTVFQRGLSSPASVADFLADADAVINEFVGILERREDLRKYKAEGDLLPLLSRLFLELTCQATLDFRMGAFSDYELRSDSDSSRLMRAALDTNSVILRTDAGLRLWRYMPTLAYRKLKKAQQIMEDFAIDRVQLKISLYDERVRPRKTLLETYLAAKELDLRDIIGIVCDFLLAGIDTSAYSASFLLYHLATNWRVQERLHDEAKRLLPSRHAPISKEVLAEASYARAVVKESLRLRPVSVGVGRVLDTDIELGGYNVPKGTSIVTQNQISSRLERYIEHPDEFLPERWLRGTPDHRPVHPFLVLPFGHGSRSCIARRFAEQNLAVLALRAARCLRLEWAGRRPLDTRSLLINRPDGPVALQYVKR